MGNLSPLPTGERARVRGLRLIKVALADDQALVRTGFRMIVQSQPDMQVVGEAADGKEAIDLVRRERPDVVLMDIRMPHVDGIQATREVASITRVLLKAAPPEDLIRAIRVVAQGEALLAPSVTRRLIEEFAKRPQPAARRTKALETLTDREREVLSEVARGYTNAEIAARLHVSETTVKTHVAHLLDKLELRDRVQAVILAYESGLAG